MKLTIICSIYRPPSSNTEYFNLCSTINKFVVTRPNGTIWYTGDTKVPIGRKRQIVVNYQCKKVPFRLTVVYTIKS